MELDEASSIRIEGMMIDPPADVAIGRPMTAVFDDVTPEVTPVKWKVV